MGVAGRNLRRANAVRCEVLDLQRWIACCGTNQKSIWEYGLRHQRRPTRIS